MLGKVDMLIRTEGMAFVGSRWTQNPAESTATNVNVVGTALIAKAALNSMQTIYHPSPERRQNHIEVRRGGTRADGQGRCVGASAAVVARPEDAGRKLCENACMENVKDTRRGVVLPSHSTAHKQEVFDLMATMCQQRCNNLLGVL